MSAIPSRLPEPAEPILGGNGGLLLSLALGWPLPWLALSNFTLRHPPTVAILKKNVIQPSGEVFPIPGASPTPSWVATMQATSIQQVAAGGKPPLQASLSNTPFSTKWPDSLLRPTHPADPPAY